MHDKSIAERTKLKLQADTRAMVRVSTWVDSKLL